MAGVFSMFLVIFVTVLGMFAIVLGISLRDSPDNRTEVPMLTDPVPPLGILLISGCNVDLCVNILLTVLGSVISASLRRHRNNWLTNISYLPGIIHALYLEHVYYSRRNVDPAAAPRGDAPGVYSSRIQHGERHNQAQRSYGTV